MGVLRAHPGIVQPGGDGMGLHDLPVVILQQVGHRAVQHALGPRRQGGGVLRGAGPIGPGRASMAASLYSHNLHVLVAQKVRKHPNGIAASPNAGDQHVGQAPRTIVVPLLVEHLRPGFPADHRLEVLHDGGERVGAHGAADDVVGGHNIGHPVPHGLIDGILQCARAALDGNHLRPQHLHPEHVELLPLHVHSTHVHNALHAKQRASGSGGDAVLSSPGLSNDSVFADLLCKQGLSYGVVDLVSAGVGKLLALEPDLRPPDLLREPLSVVKRGGPPDEFLPQARHLSNKLRIHLALVVHLLELLVGLHERLRDEPPAKPGRILPFVPSPHIDFGTLGRRLRPRAVPLAPLGELADERPHLGDALLQGGDDG
mmetsp:Transcript_14231/g.31606  ORF Transcript_14231/g.31606 Transcript_14231/m.31606 type:complete len:372 (-) Transcript_14231:486-1601(-)